MIATAPVDILRFALARSEAGLATALVTLTGIEGSAPRAIGAQMAVAEDGRYAGSLSGGCVEAAVVAEAIDALSADRARLVRFGADSPYLDIRLPCGSGLDLLFNPRPDRHALAETLARLDRREPGALRLSHRAVQIAPAAEARQGSGWHGEYFTLGLVPRLRVVAMGHGEELMALARLADAFGADVSIGSPDRRLLAQLAAEGIDGIELTTRTRLPPLATDAWTAILSLFHDRDWEDELLPLALRLPAFYVGAVGSRRTQQRRIDALVAAGVPPSLRQRLRTSVGLVPATRDPATLALSILSQIVDEHQMLGASGNALADGMLDPASTVR